MTKPRIVIAVVLGAVLGVSLMRTARGACDTEAMIRAEYPGADMEYLLRPGRNCWYARKRQGRKADEEEYRETSWPGRNHRRCGRMWESSRSPSSNGGRWSRRW
jgi:hypothetical protein